MCEIKLVNTKKLFFFIQPFLDKKLRVRITVTGSSMFPFLREHQDCVELSKPNYSVLNRNDVAIIKRDSGKFVMHRVVRKNKYFFYITGDAQSCLEGPLYPEQLIAIVSAVWRGNKRISCTNPWWRFLSYSWLLLLPCRVFILRIAKKTKDILGF